MNKKVLFITDNLEDLDLKKDTSILMMEESIKLGFDVYQCLVEDLYAENNEVIVFAKKITAAGSSEIKFEEKPRVFPIEVDGKIIKYTPDFILDFDYSVLP